MGSFAFLHAPLIAVAVVSTVNHCPGPLPLPRLVLTSLQLRVLVDALVLFTVDRRIRRSVLALLRLKWSTVNEEESEELKPGRSPRFFDRRRSSIVNRKLSRSMVWVRDGACAERIGPTGATLGLDLASTGQRRLSLRQTRSQECLHVTFEEGGENQAAEVHDSMKGMENGTLYKLTAVVGMKAVNNPASSKLREPPAIVYQLPEAEV